MSDFMTRNKLVLAKIETTRGVEEVPTVGANAVRVEDAEYTPNIETLPTNELQDGLDASESAPGGGNVTSRFSCLMKGAGTAGQAPDFGVFLRACGFSQTLIAADVTGTAQAGAAGTITLAVGASGVNDAYKGAVIDITAGTGAGQETRLITAYNGTTKVATVFPNFSVTPDATSVYAVRAGAIYRPVSVGLEAATIYTYAHHRNGTDSKLHKSIGSVGSFDMTLPTRMLGRLSFDFMGNLPAAPADVARPGAPTFGAKNEEAIKGAIAYLGTSLVKFSEYSLQLAANRAMFDNPAATFGYDTADIVIRESAGRIVPNLTLASSRDAFADWIAGTARPFWLRWGSAAGRRVSVWNPSCKYTGAAMQDVRGYIGQAIPFEARTPDGGVWINIH